MLYSLLLRKKRLNLLWIPKMRDTIKMFDFQYSCLKSLVLPKHIAFMQKSNMYSPLTEQNLKVDRNRSRINSTDSNASTESKNSAVSSASTTASERSYDGQIEWQPGANWSFTLPTAGPDIWFDFGVAVQFKHTEVNYNSTPIATLTRIHNNAMTFASDYGIYKGLRATKALSNTLVTGLVEVAYPRANNMEKVLLTRNITALFAIDDVVDSIKISNESFMEAFDAAEPIDESKFFKAFSSLLTSANIIDQKPLAASIIKFLDLNSPEASVEEFFGSYSAQIEQFNEQSKKRSFFEYDIVKATTIIDLRSKLKDATSAQDPRQISKWSRQKIAFAKELVDEFKRTLTAGQECDAQERLNEFLTSLDINEQSGIAINQWGYEERQKLIQIINGNGELSVEDKEKIAQLRAFSPLLSPESVSVLHPDSGQTANTVRAIVASIEEMIFYIYKQDRSNEQKIAAAEELTSKLEAYLESVEEEKESIEYRTDEEMRIIRDDACGADLAVRMLSNLRGVATMQLQLPTVTKYKISHATKRVNRMIELVNDLASFQKEHQETLHKIRKKYPGIQDNEDLQKAALLQKEFNNVNLAAILINKTNTELSYSELRKKSIKKVIEQIKDLSRSLKYSSLKMIDDGIEAARQDSSSADVDLINDVEDYISTLKGWLNQWLWAIVPRYSGAKLKPEDALRLITGYIERVNAGIDSNSSSKSNE